MFYIGKEGKKFVKVKGVQHITDELLEMIPQALLFYNVVWLAEPPTTKGLIELTVEKILGIVDQTHHGILVRRGTLSYTANTPGLNYVDEKNAPVEGDWVILGKHAGQRRSILVDPDMPGGWSDPMNLIHLATVTDTDIQERATAEQVKRIRGWF